MTVKFYSMDGVNSIEVMPNYERLQVSIDYLDEHGLPSGKTIELDFEDVDDLVYVLNEFKKRVEYGATTKK